jgi:HD-GYP domain-containing protein (c-di-GMP phosphodiesterase class II)
MMIPDEILMKPRSLTGKEYEIVKKHPIKGVQIIQPMDVLKPVVPIILYHHEKFDGTGYPEGLKGKQIPLGSRIMAVVDAFIAMVSKQAYRERISVQEALSEIKRYSGTQFDPNVVDAFVRVVGRINVPYLLRMKSKSLKINKKGSLIC